jgi:hypothetical protein
VFLIALAASPAFALEPTGVVPCDALLKRYEACSIKLSGKNVLAAQREILEGAESIRQAAAADAKLRPDLERYCTDRFEQMKKESDIKECMSQP